MAGSNPATPAKQRTGTFVPVLCFLQDSNLRRFAVKKQRPYFRKGAIIIECRLFSFAHMLWQIGIVYPLYLIIMRTIEMMAVHIQRIFPIYFAHWLIQCSVFHINVCTTDAKRCKHFSKQRCFQIAVRLVTKADIFFHSFLLRHLQHLRSYDVFPP